MGHVWIATVALAIPLSAIWISYLRREGRPSQHYTPSGGYDDLNDLADRLQRRIETLERLMDVAQPEWRKQP